MVPATLQALALAAAAERSARAVLDGIVEGLAAHPGVALARIWLIAPGAACPVCSARGEGDKATPVLHLVASEGTSLEAGKRWRRLEGEFHRIALGDSDGSGTKVGRIAVGDGPMLLQKEESLVRGWPRHPDWVESEQIESFLGQPLTHQGQVLGVLAVFSRLRLGETDLVQLRDFAKQSAIAIANSEAFTKMEAERRQLELDNAYLREEVETGVAPAGIIGSSPALRAVLTQVELVAPTDSTVLLLGESGTGKELFARAIHGASARRERPLIKVNCGSIPRELFESEFFGHVKGSFTGANKDRLGRFQLADRGTLFLDEVGEIPPEMQPKLLRALQEGDFERVGDERTTHVDVRVVAATNRDLAAEVAAGRFREDLYYRLDVFPIEIPPLRERLEDIPLLAEHFAALARIRVGRPSFRLTPGDLEALCRYQWPGNVRELANVIERAAILSPEGRRIDLEALLLHQANHLLPPRAMETNAKVSPPADSPLQDFVPDHVWREREKQNLLAALEHARWKIGGPGGAAELLGVKPTTLSSRMRALGVRRSRTSEQSNPPGRG